MSRGYQEAFNGTNRLFSITFLHLCGLRNEEGKRLKDGKQKIFLSWGFLLVSCSLFLGKAQAQIVPDATLPVNSIVTPSGNRSIIEAELGRVGICFTVLASFRFPLGVKHFLTTPWMCRIFSVG